MGVAANDVVGGRYRLVRRLGQGGAGTCWLARDLLLERNVTLKLLGSGAPELVASFRREFSTLCGLVHPRLCRVEDFGALPSAAGAHLFYTASFIDGVTLTAFARGRSWDAIRTAVLDAVEALAFLHQLGIRHGDFKPDNVIVSPDGRATLIDLGCCHPLDTPPLEVSGTPELLAPEVLAGRPEAASDLYAVGVTLRALGPSLATPLPDEIARLAARLIRPRPSERPSDAIEVLEALGGKSVLPRAEPDAAGRLVARAGELASCRELVESLRSGVPGPRVLFVHGPEGVGRTRLLLEMKWMAQQTLTVVEGLSTSASPIESMLARAVGGEPGLRGARAVLTARDRALSLAAPVLLCLDDVQLLTPADRAVLDALIRSASPTDSMALIVAGTDAPSIESSAITTLPLAPLGRASLREWLGAGTSDAKLTALLDQTGGLPSEVVALLGAGAGAGADADAGDRSRAPVAERRFASLPELPAEERTLLAAFVALGGRLGSSYVDLFPATALARLLADRWVRRDGDAWRLARATDAKRLASVLGSTVMIPVRRVLAAQLRQEVATLAPDDPRRVRVLGNLCEQLACLGEVAEAASLLSEARESARDGAHAFVAAADRLLEASHEPRTMLAAARAHLAAGNPRRALSVAARVLRHASEAADVGAARLLAGSAYAALRDTARAIRQLRRAVALLDGPERASAASQLSLALSRKGDYARRSPWPRPRSARRATFASKPTCDATARSQPRISAISYERARTSRRPFASVSSSSIRVPAFACSARARSSTTVLGARRRPQIRTRPSASSPSTRGSTTTSCPRL